MEKSLKVNDSFIVNALRNCGYNNYSAIADIIDNSLEPEVESSHVKVDFETEGSGPYATIKTISVIDDGNGMTREILEEAMSLGSDTGKNGSTNLGMYGAGLKTASFSIGQKLEVFTKVKGGSLQYACISLEDAINNNGSINVKFDELSYDTDEYKKFINILDCSHGTIVKISILDKLTNRNYQSFKGCLKNKIGESFNKFIYADVANFYVKNDEIPYVDLMGNSLENDLMGEGSFEVDGHSISYRAWYIQREGGETESSIENNEHSKCSNGTEYMSRTMNNQGLYIYRQNRLVGKGLTLGLFTKHPMKNGFRCEIFVDGNCDYLFGSTFTKTVQERSKDTMSQSLLDKLSAEINPFVKEVERRDKKAIQAIKDNDPNEKKITEEFYKRVTEKQNKNMMLKANRKGENTRKEDDEKEHEKRGPQKNPNPTKARTNKWLDGFEERPMGRAGDMYGMERSNGRRIIVINTEHPFYQKFYSKLDNELKFTMAQVISCDEIAKQNVNYYGSDEVQNILDNYDAFKSSEVSKSLCF